MPSPQYSQGKTDVRLCVAVLSFFCIFSWTIKEHFAVKLELKEAHGLLADIIYGSYRIDRNLSTGNVEKALAFAVTNQLRGMQYVIRRDVKDESIRLAVCACSENGSLPLTQDQHMFFTRYNRGYMSWAKSGWMDGSIPLMNQITDVLYYYWSDGRPRWTTWKPRDHETNITAQPWVEHVKSRFTTSEERISIPERINNAVNELKEKPSDE